MPPTPHHSYWKRLIPGILIAEALVFLYFQYDVNRFPDFYLSRCGEEAGEAACLLRLYGRFHWDLGVNLVAMYSRSLFEGVLMTLLAAVFVVPFFLRPRVLTWLPFFLFFLVACFLRVVE